MEKLYFPDEVAARYRVTERTAKSYMRKMRHMTKPLAVTESALFAYEQGVAKTIYLTSDPFLVTGANLNPSVARVLAWLTSGRGH